MRVYASCAPIQVKHTHKANTLIDGPRFICSPEKYISTPHPDLNFKHEASFAIYSETRS